METPQHLQVLLCGISSFLLPYFLFKILAKIEIEYFPFDTQECMMKFGGWTYTGFLMNISKIPVWPIFAKKICRFLFGLQPRPEDVIETRHYPDGREYKYLALGMDLSAYHQYSTIRLLSLCYSQLGIYSLGKESGMGSDVRDQQPT